MYTLTFSRYDCPGCDYSWYFDTIEEIEYFIKESYPKFPVAEWPLDCKFYPNGLSIWKNVPGDVVYNGLYREVYDVMVMESMVDAHDFSCLPPKSLYAETDKIAQLIYDLQIIVDKLEDGEEYEWPIDQIVPRVDKEELVKTVFHPSRVMKMGGFEWIECV
jgi:hypothetical protein